MLMSSISREAASSVYDKYLILIVLMATSLTQFTCRLFIQNIQNKKHDYVWSHATDCVEYNIQR